MDKHQPLRILHPTFVGGWPVRVELESSFDGFLLLHRNAGAGGSTDELTIRELNLAAERLLGQPRQQLIGTSIKAFLGNELFGLDFECLTHVIHTQEPFETRLYQTREESGQQILRIQVVPAGEGLSIAISDVTSLNQAKNVLVDNQLFIEKLTGSLPELIYVFDATETVLSFRNRDFMVQLGYPPDTAGDGLLSLKTLIHPEDQNACFEHAEDLQASHGDEIKEMTCRVLTAKNEWRWFQIRTTVFRRDENDRPIEFLRTIQDISVQLRNEVELREIVKQLKLTQIELRERQMQLQQLNHQLASLATTDGLTGLFNYRAFNEKLGEETRRAKRYGHPLSVVMADIDDFKVFNDRFGHPAGDERLRFFARLLRECSRNSDFIARYGGEEFAMILSNTNAAGAAAFAQSIVERLNEDNSSKRITASFGCAELESESETKEDLVRKSDECLYAAKRQGKNRVVLSQRDQEAVSSGS